MGWFLGKFNKIGLMKSKNELLETLIILGILKEFFFSQSSQKLTQQN
jgi:hypothetical protein